MGALAVAALMVVATACADEPYKAGTVGGGEDPAAANGPDGSDGSGGADDPETPEPEDTDAEQSDPPEDEPEFDVCAAIPAERVRELAGREEVPEVSGPGEADQGDEDAAGIYNCTYKWEPGETHQLVRISLSRDAGDGDAASYVENILGPEYEPVDGVGEAAGIDREQRFGNQISALASAGQTESGLAGVLVLGAEEFETTVFTGIAAEAFGALDQAG